MPNQSTAKRPAPKRPSAVTSTDADFPKGVSAPARRALAAAGYTRLDQLTRARESDLMQLHGFGPKAIKVLRAALAERGKTFAAPK